MMLVDRVIMNVFDGVRVGSMRECLSKDDGRDIFEEN